MRANIGGMSSQIIAAAKLAARITRTIETNQAAAETLEVSSWNDEIEAKTPWNVYRRTSRAIRVLIHVGAASVNKPGAARPFTWLWRPKDLAGLKPFLDYSWETLAGMFQYPDGRPASAAALRNNVPTDWKHKHPEILEKLQVKQTFKNL